MPKKNIKSQKNQHDVYGNETSEKANNSKELNLNDFGSLKGVEVSNIGLSFLETCYNQIIHELFDFRISADAGIDVDLHDYQHLRNLKLLIPKKYKVISEILKSKYKDKIVTNLEEVNGFDLEDVRNKLIILDKDCRKLFLISKMIDFEFKILSINNDIENLGDFPDEEYYYEVVSIFKQLKKWLFYLIDLTNSKIS